MMQTINNGISVIDEINNANNQIKDLKSYKSNNWGIGFNGESLVPDGFLAFFDERNLSFQYYVRCSKYNVSIGDSSAYQKNIDTLIKYINIIRGTEIAFIDSVISSISDYKAKNWAIGINGDTLEPDRFPSIFVTRSLPFHFYILNGGITGLNNPKAYDENISELKNYLAKLPNVIA